MAGDAPPEFLRLAAHPLRWRLLSALAAGDARVRELMAGTGESQNLVSYHLGLLRRGGLVTTRRSTHDARDTYYHLDLTRCAGALAEIAAALHPALVSVPGDDARQSVPPAASGHPLARTPAVLFVCTGNSSRSLIAEALLRHRSGGAVDVTSAGTHPRREIHPLTLAVLRKDYGLDLGPRDPRAIQAVADRTFDLVVTVCDRAREALPELREHPRLSHWSIPDPAHSTPRPTYSTFRATAAEIDTRVGHLVPALTVPGASRTGTP